jgi:hypothetical protein
MTTPVIEPSTSQKPVMEVRQLKDHSGWYVRLTWAGGRVEDVDVSTEAEAREWIGNRSAAWLAGRVQSRTPDT